MNRRKTVVVEMVSPEEAEQCEGVVCMRASDSAGTADDEFAPCAWGCGHTVRYRPYMPKAPPKVCVQCYLEAIEAQAQGKVQ